MRKLAIWIPIVAISAMMAGCGPYKQEIYEEVSPSETAFLVALEDGDQGKFESIEYLEKKKVAAKRIIIPQRQLDTGRMPGDYKWIPTARVIKVDRSPISRKWTGDRAATTEGASKDLNPATAPLEVESLDSIGFAVGVTITARIDEADAAQFLYYHSGKQLSDVIDSNIKSYILTLLSEEFGAVNLTACREKKNDIFNRVERQTVEFFKKKGITVEYMGLSEGLTYLDQKIQDAIDASFLAEQDKSTAQQEQQAAKIRNATRIAEVAAQASAARALTSNMSAAIQKMRLDIQLKLAEAEVIKAQKWDGALPASVVPANTPFLQSFLGGGK